MTCSHLLLIVSSIPSLTTVHLRFLNVMEQTTHELDQFDPWPQTEWFIYSLGVLHTKLEILDNTYVVLISWIHSMESIGTKFKLHYLLITTKKKKLPKKNLKQILNVNNIILFQQTDHPLVKLTCTSALS